MLTLILKGTNGCNLNCAYCSLGEKSRHDIVSDQTLMRIFEYACNTCRQRNELQLEIILHGGEPTLVPINTYNAAIRHVRALFPDIQISLSMQTNAFCISDEYLSFLQCHNVNIGVSIDGSAEIHNQERKSRGGHDTFVTVTENIARMQAVGLNVSALMVLTAIGLNAPLDYLNYYASRHIHLKINPLLNYGEACKNPELAIKKGDYANYLIRVYEYIVVNHIDVTVSPIDKLLQAILRKDKIRECTFNAECNYGFLCIDHIGDIYPCGKFCDIHAFKLGNVSSQNLDVLGSPQFQRLTERRSCRLPTKCRECRYLNLCQGGCSAEAYIEQKFDEQPFLCEDYQMLFDYFSSTGLRLLREQLVKSKQYLMEKADGV
ncbi:MAG: radical SAM protein [Candidatus Riflebacteria bacterium]|nr:radical SAM protein [Candidatus Riflebacteria bacterium]